MFHTTGAEDVSSESPSEVGAELDGLECAITGELQGESELWSYVLVAIGDLLKVPR